MRRRNLLIAACVALVWSGSAAAQAPPGNPASPANTANPANPTTVSQNRVRVAAADAQGQGNRRDCTQLRGLEKSECERRDTSRDDLPAGVTATQKKPRS